MAMDTRVPYSTIDARGIATGLFVLSAGLGPVIYLARLLLRSQLHIRKLRD